MGHVWPEPEPKRQRRSGKSELPYGVGDGVEDSLKRRADVVRFGVISGMGTPFWEWTAGRGLEHIWTCKQGSPEVGGRLQDGSAEVILFESGKPRRNHAVWVASGINIVVWNGATCLNAPPVGWRVETVDLKHAELGGVTNGHFQVHRASRVEVEPVPLRP